MTNKNLMRDPVSRNQLGETIDKSIPDLAYEISSQSLEKMSGGTTPVCASIMATVYITSIITGVVTAATSKTEPWNPEDDGPPKPTGK